MILDGNHSAIIIFLVVIDIVLIEVDHVLCLGNEHHAARTVEHHTAANESRKTRAFIIKFFVVVVEAIVVVGATIFTRDIALIARLAKGKTATHERGNRLGAERIVSRNSEIHIIERSIVTQAIDIPVDTEQDYLGIVQQEEIKTGKNFDIGLDSHKTTHGHTDIGIHALALGSLRFLFRNAINVGIIDSLVLGTDVASQL